MYLAAVETNMMQQPKGTSFFNLSCARRIGLLYNLDRILGILQVSVDTSPFANCSKSLEMYLSLGFADTAVTCTFVVSSREEGPSAHRRGFCFLGCVWGEEPFVFFFFFLEEKPKRTHKEEAI